MDRIESGAAEFSRVVLVERLNHGEIIETIVAGDEEREAVARRFGLLALERLEAVLTLRRLGRGPVARLEGRLLAEVVQTCVVSLEPVANRIEETFIVLFAPEGQGQLGGGTLAEAVLETDDEWPEPIQDGRIDIGEAVAQQLALALDPYPRKPGIRLEDVIMTADDDVPGGRDKSPFAGLAGLVKPAR